MFKRLFSRAKKAPQTSRSDDGEESSPLPSSSVDTESTGSRFSPKRLFKRLWKKVKASSKPMEKRNKVSPAPFIEPEQKLKLKAGKEEVPVTELWKNDQDPVLPKEKFDPSHYGLPNLGNTCYLNASVQSIMSITPFMERVSAQENIWKHCEEAELLRHLQAIEDLRKPSFKRRISQMFLMSSFKKTISAKAEEFCGGQQKDAHEFLTVLMEQIQSLAPTLQTSASSLGSTYVCPVQELMHFSMDWTRTCQRCGSESSRRECISNISLDVRSCSTVDLLLQDYLKATELEFRCDCGGQMSSLKSSFASLPKVLILHLKRFRFTPQYQVEKVSDDVHLNRDLVVSSSEDSGCFSLMGVVSHIGPTADSGHYIFDGRSPADNPLLSTDDWLNYNDSSVHETCGRTICRDRTSTAYILFYQRVTAD